MNTYRVPSIDDLRILTVCATDRGGGAEASAWRLYKAYQNLGYDSWLAVGHKERQDEHIFEIPNEASRKRSTWYRGVSRISHRLDAVQNSSVKRTILRMLRFLGEPGRSLRILRGFEDFDYPGTRQLLSLTPKPPTLIHCHNLHGGYFDLRQLEQLSRQVPVILNLRDTWLLSGHCAHYFDCPRWQTGCGHCPDLTIYPSVRRDETAANWKIKRDIYARSWLYVTSPAQWALDAVSQSMLGPAARLMRVIPNSVDHSIFHPADRAALREKLNLPSNAVVFTYVATKITTNRFKDYSTVRGAILRFAEGWQAGPVVFLAVGDDQPEEQHGAVTIRFLPYQTDLQKIAEAYQVSDVYLHAARADTYPNTVLEALACGLPVVGTAVGGIPEQVEEGKTGFLTPAGDASAMAERISYLVSRPELRKQMSVAAAADSLSRFAPEIQAARFLDWYVDILADWKQSRKPG
jgi:glycosyltransferase involved in cell wall biosynthesis